MTTLPLHYVWDYREVDRVFWQTHLENWLPSPFWTPTPTLPIRVCGGFP